MNGEPDLSRLKRDVAPPPALEERTVASLRAARMLSPRRSQPLRWLVTAAAIAVAFAGGIVAARATPSPASGPRFVLLLYGGDADPSRDRHAEYAAWARTVATRGLSISGEELSGPPEDAVPRGYFIVSARTSEQANQVAASCPHVRYGGRIVVRAIVSGS
jgi:hypothetical protein